MAVERRQYTAEFKQEAVRLMTQGGLSAAQVARDLGINATLLGKWKRQFEAGQQAPVPRGRFYGLRALFPPALLLFYVVAADKLGFILTAAFIVLVTSTALGARPKLSVPLAILAPIGIHLIFAKVLRVPLPIGLIPMPW